MARPGRSASPLRRVINAAGTMTVLGASAAIPEAIRAAADILPRFVEIEALQAEASRVIAAATGTEAGFITAGASAGMTLAIAGAMTGLDLARVHQLPDTRRMPNRIAVQRGHLVDYGAPVDQSIRIAGARVAPVGRRQRATPADLEAALDARTAAALYVVSHHTEQVGQIALGDFVALCARRGIPVVVDAASEYDLRGFAAEGADIVIYSAHKFLGGLTAGIVAGRKDLVRAAYLQNLGIGRGMKVGKEGIAGAIAALDAWGRRDHDAVRCADERRAALWLKRLAGAPGFHVEPSPDPTGNPITRVRVHVGAASGTSAWELADLAAEGDPAVMVRDDEVAHGFFELDPCNLSDGEAAEAAERLLAVVATTLRRRRHTPLSLEDWATRRHAARLAWPDRPPQSRR